jgi:purine catabolism regulator
VPTVAELLAYPGLGLRVLAGDTLLDREIRWVATSEHPDPTPFLQGGELLLTTGMRLGKTLDAVRAFASRLHDAGVVGIGYGVGVVSEQVPKRLQRAASEHGLVLIEVDVPTPFVAIGKAVSDMLASQQYAEVTRGYRAQQELTRVAVRGGVAGVVRTLARSLDGWVLLLDGRGAVLQAFPAGARDRAAGLRPEVQRLRSAGRAALSLVQADEHVSVHPVGTGARAQAFLVAGTPRTPLASDRALLGLAGALLAVVGHRGDDEPARRRSAAMLSLVRSGAVADPGTLVDLGATVLRSPSVHVVAAGGTHAEVERWAQGVEEAAADDCLVVSAGDTGCAVLAGSPADDDSLEATHGLCIGVSDACPPDRLGAAIEQADRALAAAQARKQTVVRYADVLAGPVGLADPADAAAFADRLLAPLRAVDDTGGADLLATLRVWLEHHGQLGPAAAALGVHRHTMRHRVRRAESLLGRSLDDIDSRMELWYALRVVQNV